MKSRLRSNAMQLARVVAFSSLVAAVQGQSDDTLQVLVLTDFDQRSGPFVKVANAFSSELIALEPRPISMRFVDLNARDQKAISAQDLQRLMVQRLFDTRVPDLVLALGPPAVEFWQQNRGEEYRSVPLLAAAAEVGGLNPEFFAGQWATISRFSFADQVADIRSLLPDTRHILMVFGATLHERKLADVAAKQIKAAFADIELETSTHLSLEKPIDRESALQRGSVVYFVFMDTDANGETIREEDGLALVRAASQVRVFGPFDGQLGHGIVGGRLIQLEAIGKAIASQAYRILNNQPEPKGLQYFDLGSPVFDARELDAWQIPLKRLPPASNVLYQPASLWQRYRPWIVILGLLVILQFWLTIQWMVQRQRARVIAETNANLGRRLITAYEDERRLIARELHVDLSQRLARLTIDASLASGAADP